MLPPSEARTPRPVTSAGSGAVICTTSVPASPETASLATSSTTAYGALADNPVPLTEDAPTRATPSFNYAHDKRLMDEMLRQFAAAHPSVKVCIVRPCIVLGPTVGNYIATSLITQPVGALLDGSDPALQFIHEDELVRMIATCVEQQAAGVYNAVGEGTVTTREAAAMQGKPALYMPYKAVWAAVWGVQKLKLLGFNMPPGILEFFRHSWVASGDKARRELGFAPQHSSRACFELLLARKDEVVQSFKQSMKARGKR